jgi:hypothetical protein
MTKAVITLALLAAAGLTACSSNSSSPPAAANPPTPMTGTITHATPSAEVIAARMKLHGIKAYNATTDPNKLLGRQGEYTSKVNWGPGRNNSIEVFKSNADLIDRANYVSGFKCPFGDGYDFTAGTALLRLGCDLTPAQAHAVEARFSAAVKAQ